MAKNLLQIIKLLLQVKHQDWQHFMTSSLQLSSYPKAEKSKGAVQKLVFGFFQSAVEFGDFDVRHSEGAAMMIDALLGIGRVFSDQEIPELDVAFAEAKKECQELASSLETHQLVVAAWNDLFESLAEGFSLAKVNAALLALDDKMVDSLVSKFAGFAKINFEQILHTIRDNLHPNLIF